MSKDVTDTRHFPRCGRFVTLAAPSALVVLTTVWLFLGATPVRAVLLWCSLASLAACLVVWGVVTLRNGDQSRRDTYRWVVRAASATPGCGEGTVPLRLRGGGRQSARLVSLLVVVPTLTALWVALAAADARGTGTSAVLAEAGAVIERLPIVKIENEDAGWSPRSSAQADYTVLLPSPTRKEGVPATFEAATHRRQGISGKLYVAYVPEQPELGAIGDDRLAEVKRQLAGRAVESGTARDLGGLWALVTLALVVGAWRSEATHRPARTVTPDWHALRVTVGGTGQHTEVPPPGSPEGADEKKRRENTRRVQCLVLEGRGQGIPFHSQMGIEPAGEVLIGTRGWLLWHPSQRRGRDVLAELVSDDGWHLPGAVPIRVAEEAVAEGLTEAARPDFERRVRTLDLGAGWLVTASLSGVAGFAVAFGCLVTLLLVPDSGVWRWWVALAGVLAPGVGFMVRAVARTGDRAVPSPQ
ncbi:hypothetical protein [Streptomyces sp. NRRL B-3229]|uniref:hypothetical protein n=1 Tax=Streptomyces sp. NRRL B-3229 TaxID=1463836 RepID=UPI001F3B4157|nr:hypothetical protein [Streptomyces sp. NRRL B-3229]